MHISALANRYVSDPREVVKAGDVVKVKVLEVDAARKRIALTMRLDDEGVAAPKRSSTSDSGNQKPRERNQDRAENMGNSAMADAFSKLKR